MSGVADMAKGAWRAALLASFDANKHNKFSTYFQLATVRPNGRPANRTVVYRGFVGDSNLIQFWTDTRSDKVAEIEHCSWGEACFYFSDTWQQFRLSGQLYVIKGQDADSRKQQLRKDSWYALSARQRKQFAYPPPKQPRAAAQAFEVEIDEKQEPPDTYGLVTLDPESVDYVHLKENRRVLYDKQDGSGWTEEEVNP